jgi:hypothetical protein
MEDPKTVLREAYEELQGPREPLHWRFEIDVSISSDASGEEAWTPEQLAAWVRARLVGQFLDITIDRVRSRAHDRTLYRGTPQERVVPVKASIKGPDWAPLIEKDRVYRLAR